MAGATDYIQQRHQHGVAQVGCGIATGSSQARSVPAWWATRPITATWLYPSRADEVTDWSGGRIPWARHLALGAWDYYITASGHVEYWDEPDGHDVWA